MKTIVALLAGMMLMSVCVFAGSQTTTGEVRSPTGKLLYKTKTSGNTTEVRSPTGKLLLKTKTQDGSTEVRSPTGKLLQKIKVK